MHFPLTLYIIWAFLLLLVWGIPYTQYSNSTMTPKAAGIGTLCQKATGKRPLPLNLGSKQGISLTHDSYKRRVCDECRLLWEKLRELGLFMRDSLVRDL